MSDGPSTVTAIRRRRGTQRRTIEVDGEPWLDLPASVVASGSIAVGIRIDPDALRGSLREALDRCARERAYRLLSFKDRSSHELTARLLEDGYPADVVDALVEDLTGRGIVDDLRFLEAYVTMLVRQRGFGRSRIEAEITRKGISRDAATPVLDALLPVEQEADRAEHAALRLRSGADTVPRLASRLVRRGFSHAEALRAARHALGRPAQPDGECDPPHSEAPW